MDNFMNFMPENPILGFAYVPFQKWPDNLYDLEQGLMYGTIFPELNQPVSMYEVGETR
ncbi:MAG: spore coat associated protein CotJA [Clostridia bacterium]|nr:spore coat associated protein CotJA [Clostridia bacterium]MBQ2754926.1 spore coat associated protein CotJA [Clostridia bacterium]MBQ3115261.1 spore coat associated protein CotJA [Clostridia bacterium]